jgi:hypothetical protein
MLRSLLLLRRKLFTLVSVALLLVSASAAVPIPVRHVEGVSLGFLVVRSLDGRILAFGSDTQVVKAGIVINELVFRFKDGSLFKEVTRFTQHREFRLVSDHVLQKGPSFKQQSETWIDATTGMVKVDSIENGKRKSSEKHLDLPPDVSNGLLFTLVKNLDSAARENTVSEIAASGPRIVKLNILPVEEKVITVGLISNKAQQYVVKTKIEGVAGVVAPIVGKQPPDIYVWIIKGSAPTFLEFKGPLSQGNPVWRIGVISPDIESAEVKLK